MLNESESCQLCRCEASRLRLGPKRAIYCRGLVPEDSLTGFETIEILCGGPTTANIICLGPDEVIVGR
ncbi:MAG TPA: hypothetical protein VM537_24420, partial [Anaerolineae bacterium]|nr:hypothetical protein [Anaerolineae bacterium]